MKHDIPHYRCFGNPRATKCVMCGVPAEVRVVDRTGAMFTLCGEHIDQRYDALVAAGAVMSS